VGKAKTFELTCIVCPVGCKAKVTVKNGEVKVKDVECPRGREYAVNEIREPTRDLFTTVRVKEGRIPVCSVRSTRPVPKDKVIDCAKEIAKVVVAAPIKANDVILENIQGLGVNIVATRDVDRAARIAARLQKRAGH